MKVIFEFIHFQNVQIHFQLLFAQTAKIHSSQNSAQKASNSGDGNCAVRQSAADGPNQIGALQTDAGRFRFAASNQRGRILCGQRSGDQAAGPYPDTEGINCIASLLFGPAKKFLLPPPLSPTDFLPCVFLH